MNWRRYPKKPTVAQQRAKALKATESLRKKNKDIQPVVIDGRRITTTFWGKAWCDNLELYHDYASRLPRGRSYVRSGCVLNLTINPGCIEALVQGSRRYQVRVDIKRLSARKWKEFKQDTSGQIASTIALLKGDVPDSVLHRIIEPSSGLFPSPAEITLHCNCPDWAVMCKHVAAVLYGVGNRLDTQPELFFTLRQVDMTELITHMSSAEAITGGAATNNKTTGKLPTIAKGQLAGVFGIELAAPAVSSKKKAAANRAVATGSKRKKKAAANSKKTPGLARKKTASRARKKTTNVKYKKIGKVSRQKKE